MSSHQDFVKVLRKGAKCDTCNQRNRGVMQKCRTCALCTCSKCHENGVYDRSHNLSNRSDLDWEPEETRSSRLARGRSRAARQSQDPNIVGTRSQTGSHRLSKYVSAIDTRSQGGQALLQTPQIQLEASNDRQFLLGSRTRSRTRGLIREQPNHIYESGATPSSAAVSSSPTEVDLQQTVASGPRNAPLAERHPLLHLGFCPQAVPTPVSTAHGNPLYPADNSDLLTHLNDTWLTNPELRKIYQSDGLTAALELMEASIELEGIRKPGAWRIVARNWVASIHRRQESGRDTTGLD